LKTLNRQLTKSAINHLIEDLKNFYQDSPHVQTYLDSVERDIIENVENFISGEEARESILATSPTSVTELHRYKVNVLVDNSQAKGAPVIYLDHPSYQNLVGRAEHTARLGTLYTDFTQLKAGALHRANGGYLMVDVRKLLMQPYAWEGLKRALYGKDIRIESLENMLGLMSTTSLEPEPMPLDIKLVLMGDRLLYYLLEEYDPDFAELFKVMADFEDRMERNSENNLLYAQLIATLARKEQLRPFDRKAVARLIEYGSRLIEDSEKLSTHMRSIADLLREADYWAGENGHKHVCTDDVQQAIDQQLQRASRAREHIHEEIQRGTILIDSDGAKVGQINGLSILSLGNYAFGQPSRITATTHIGEDQVVDIEREVELGGEIHSKGVMILSAFLASRYASKQPLSLSASLVFEQSYGMVEGDSASLAELCALLSSLADLPIKQSLAITGSVSQQGEVQAIGGVNEKIEGFFDVCQARGLTGEQGVLIPAANIKHLMLREDVVKAASAGQFSVYPVETVDQAISLMTGTEAGEMDAEGTYPADSINGRVLARLTEMAKIRHEFSEHGKPVSDNPADHDENGAKKD
ncbi:MAG: Lon protease family protein, partial [Gammaproteobacteria bacterium]|nr:Lon protease family protein [Gammaproteobacteria bacterium]